MVFVSFSSLLVLCILWDTLLAPIFFIFYLFLPIKKKKKKKKNTIKINCCFKFFLMCLVNLFPQ